MKRFVSLVLALMLCAGLAAPALAADFSDVSADHWAYSAIQTAAEKGITSGYSDGTFKPSAPVTNIQFVVMLSRAFYAEDVAQWAADAATAKNDWWWPNWYAMTSKHLLTGNELFENQTSLEERGNLGITRQDMAWLLADVLKEKGGSATEEQKAGAQAQIADYASIPTGYQEAVKTAFALGLITGYSDGTFGGEKTMNRAQGCIVIHRLAQYVGDGSGAGPVVSADTEPANRQEDPAGPGSSETAPETPKPTTVNVTSTKTNNGTAWTVPDNGYSTGYLNNGKPVTESNVKAMLADAEKIWPDGMTWTVEGASGNNYYGNKGAIADGYTAWQIIHGAHRTDANYACGGFACMLSDYIFGPNASNPCRKLNDNTKVRPGDIVISTLNGTTTHVMIATSTVWYKSNRPGVFITNGNVSNQVDWTSTNGVPIDSYTNSAGTVAHIIYTRYPD